MDEKIVYERVLKKLYDGLSTDNHKKYKNSKLSEKKFAINDLYPDIILTKKDSEEVEFIVEILTESSVIKENIIALWKPLSVVGPYFYLVVPKSKYKTIEKWCIDEKIKVRFGIYEEKDNEIELNFL